MTDGCLLAVDRALPRLETCSLRRLQFTSRLSFLLALLCAVTDTATAEKSLPLPRLLTTPPYLFSIAQPLLQPDRLQGLPGNFSRSNSQHASFLPVRKVNKVFSS